MKTISNEVLPEPIRIIKLVHGGQGLGELSTGKKVFVWNALPGELVKVRIIKQRRSFADAIAEEIIEPSAERITPREDNYLATSPWQMMTFEAENKYKQTIVEELFSPLEALPSTLAPTIHTDQAFHYRNKMEYSFWGDDSGLHLALHQRGSHGKQAVKGSALAMPALDAAAEAVRAVLGERHVRAGDLKTVIVRCSARDEAVVGLFVKVEDFQDIGLPSGLKGLRVYYSNPKSPASVPTRLLYEHGNCQLEDVLLGKNFTYDVDSFFQVNVPIFEHALQEIASGVGAEHIVDMYAGVGSIGLSVATRAVDLVELDAASTAMAHVNAAASSLEAHVIEAPTEKALEYITQDKPVIFDPPRAGLHPKVIARISEAMPPRIVYLSCNPATQARDLQMLEPLYEISSLQVFNFFPRTPHIETLAILNRKLIQ